MSARSKVLTVLACVVVALLFQQALGQALVVISERIYPRETSALGMAGLWIMPFPFLFGLVFLPFSALGVYYLGRPLWRVVARRSRGI